MKNIIFFIIFCPIVSNAQKTKVIRNSPEIVKTIDGKVFRYIEQMPEPPYDVNKYLAETIRYPKAAKDSNIDGRVITGFIVTETGAIDSPYIYRGKHPLLDAEALRVVKSMPPWKPGKLQGKTVRVNYKMPITFKLE